ncbi:MAG TPA: hypothetical protein VH325_08485 [Bryobacteraceae bacterium]|nr:hypothetical protein [Bryobacteraceae bacterium]
MYSFRDAANKPYFAIYNGVQVFTRAIQLTPDGRFERSNGALHGTGVTQSAGGFSGSASSVEDRNERRASSAGAYNGGPGGSSSLVATGSSRSAGRGNTSGAYSVSGYSLELQADDGSVQRLLAFYPFVAQGKDRVFIEGATFNSGK